MILFFSGTGNSRAVAEEVGRRLGERVEAMDCIATAPRIDLEGDTRVVWVFPVYSWGIPAVVKRFMRRAEIVGAETAEHYMVTTCGDDVGLTHLEWRRTMRRRSWSAVGTYSVQMPNTYVSLPGFDVDTALVEDEKLKGAWGRIERVVHAIKCRARVDDVVRGSMPWLKSRIVRPVFLLFLTSPRHFRVSEACTGCGRCAKVCPMKNIALEGVTPTWGKECAMCLACYHTCPADAINWGTFTRGKGHYRCRGLKKGD